MLVRQKDRPVSNMAEAQVRPEPHVLIVEQPGPACQAARRKSPGSGRQIRSDREAEESRVPRPRADPPELVDLVPDAGRLLVVLERHGEAELLLQALHRPARPLLLDVPPPAQQEPQLGAVRLLVRLLIVAEELADLLDAAVDLRQT